MNKHQEEFQTVTFPLARKEDWQKVLPIKLIDLQPGIVVVDCLDWVLSCRDFKKIKVIFHKAGLEIKLIQSNIPETIVSASSLGYQTILKLEENEKAPNISRTSNLSEKNKSSILFHQGTLRSGESLDTEGNVLLLGDVNPGAKISAGGDVMVWGRLRGVAHAGKDGNNQAKIVSLQLRPLQLRIANKIARGPEERPQEGLAEEALIEFDQIVIKPARINAFKSFNESNNPSNKP